MPPSHECLHHGGIRVNDGGIRVMEAQEAFLRVNSVANANV